MFDAVGQGVFCTHTHTHTDSPDSQTRDPESSALCHDTSALPLYLSRQEKERNERCANCQSQQVGDRSVPIMAWLGMWRRIKHSCNSLFIL